MRVFAEGSTLIRVPVSVRDKLASLRRKKHPKGSWSPQETLGEVVKRLAEGAPSPAKPVRKKTTSSGRKVNNKARRHRGRRHR